MTLRIPPALRAACASGAVALLLAGTFLGGRASVSGVASDSGPQAAAAATSTWTVQEGKVGRTLSFPGQITAVAIPGPLLNVDGTVTALALKGPATVGVGDRLVDVNLRPVVAGQGAVPAFRDLAQGAKGTDVVQLRRFLCSQRLLRQCGTYDTFTPQMTAAVRTWQTRLGVQPDGVVTASLIMWFPTMPVRLRPATATTTPTTATTAVGQRLAATDRPFDVLSGAPQLVVRVTRAQAALAPAGSTVMIGTSTKGVVLTVRSSGDAADTAVLIDVAAPGGDDPVCSKSPECATLLGNRSAVDVDVSVEVVPKQTGPAVPVRALLTRADDTTYVLTEDNRQLPVEVVGTSGGLALVDGIPVGTKIVLPTTDG